MHNPKNKEYNNSRQTSFLFGDKLINYDIKFEDFPMLQEISSPDGLDAKLDKYIKVKCY